MPDALINRRKIEHIDIIRADSGVERTPSAFAHIRLAHRALPEINLADIDTSCEFLGKTLAFPLIISSMTGGDHDMLRTINRRLAEAAEHCQVALAVGSQRVMFHEAAARESFALRRFAPNVPLIGNLGAVQFNKGFTACHIEEAVAVLDGDGLYLHLNPLQEAVQPEGDTEFAGLAARLPELVEKSPVPLLLKEVGCGLSAADIELGLAAGIRHFDIAGHGGTSWSRIEAQRSADNFGFAFQDWGLPSAQALSDAHQQHPGACLIASGGVRSGLDMAKAIVLGAGLCGIAAPFLHAALDSTKAVIAVIERLEREYRTALFLLGCPDTRALRGESRYLYPSDPYL
ncbi:MAG: type 2 isopentenyl-diphosphate Delta-isomerase [Cardiobacteriaceae bacterium]|nr:type 2 isopentenyl-diphosphate Delta-isomerase [Cardiobacteriaceae bacterium]